MIKAIFFDLDGVLTTDKNGTTTGCRYFAEKLGVDWKEIYEKKRGLEKSSNHETAWRAICLEYGIDFNPEWLQQAYESAPIDDKMLELAKDLKSEYKIGIITDNESERARAIAEKYDWYTLFDVIVVSADVGSTKKTPQIFEIAMERLGVLPNECIFIDNTKRNLETSSELGIHSIYFDDEVRDFDRLIGEINELCRTN